MVRWWRTIASVRHHWIRFYQARDRPSSIKVLSRKRRTTDRIQQLTNTFAPPQTYLRRPWHKTGRPVWTWLVRLLMTFCNSSGNVYAVWAITCGFWFQRVCWMYEINHKGMVSSLTMILWCCWLDLLDVVRSCDVSVWASHRDWKMACWVPQGSIIDFKDLPLWVQLAPTK
jgi:hypothetical protein